MGFGGAGKSYSALLLARGLVGEKGKILVIETEGGRIDVYDQVTDFDVHDLTAPYTVDKFLDAIYETAKMGYGCVIVDSMSSEWSGKGGLLDLADNQTNRSGGKLQYPANWKIPKAMHEDLKEAIRNPPLDIICTFRVKESTKAVGAGKDMRVVDEGVKLDSDKSTEYEFGLIMNIALYTHQAKAQKDVYQIFGQQPKALTIKDGERLAEWRGTAPVETAEGVYEDLGVADLLSGLNYDDAQHKAAIKKLIGKASPTSPTTLTKLTAYLEKLYGERGLELPPKDKL